MKTEYEIFFLLWKHPSLKIRPQVIYPPQSAALPTPLQTCNNHICICNWESSKKKRQEKWRTNIQTYRRVWERSSSSRRRNWWCNCRASRLPQATKALSSASASPYKNGDPCCLCVCDSNPNWYLCWLSGREGGREDYINIMVWLLWYDGKEEKNHFLSFQEF